MARRGAAASLLLALALCPALASAIYPSDHFDYSTKLTSENFEDKVKEVVDSGKTLFAPSWNKIVREYAGNDDVEFGDINLSTDYIAGEHQPGAGGWPTIRYFNTKTGYGGAPYVQKTDQAMCDELGKTKNMRKYVEDYGNTIKCNPKNLTGCSESEKEYVIKWSALTHAERGDEMEKLRKKAKSKKRIVLLRKMKGMHGPPPQANTEL